MNEANYVIPCEKYTEFIGFENANPCSSLVNIDIYNLGNFIPVIYNDKNEKKYIDTLFTAFEMSYSNSLFQFAYIQVHMLFMVSIYYSLLKLYCVYPDRVHDAVFYMLKDKSKIKDFFTGTKNTRNGKLFFGSFALINESDIFLLLKIVKVDSAFLGELRKFVRKRNDYAHANGIITIISQDTMDREIFAYIDAIKRINELFVPIVEQLYLNTISNIDFYDPENRFGYIENDEQIREEFIKKYNLSISDIEVCSKLDMSNLSDNKDYNDIQNIHNALCKFYENNVKEHTNSEHSNG